MLIIKNQEDYAKIVNNNKLNILVDFYADWCGPCKLLTPKLEELEKNVDNMLFLKVNVDNEDCSKICELYEVSSMPTIIFLKNKVEEKDLRVIGNNIDSIKDNIEKLNN